MQEPKTRRQFVTAAVSTPAVLGLAGLTEAGRPGSRIRVGQIGTKHAHASGQIRTMRKYTEHFEVVGAVQPDERVRRKADESEAYRGLKWMTEEQLLNTPGLKAVAIETEVRDLLATAQRCVDAGMHIHLDKPAGASFRDLKKLHAAAERKGLCIQMGYMFRYNPGFRFIFQAARDGWFGDIFEVHGVISKKIGADSRQKLAEFPGGSMFELGCHLIDPLLHLMGVPDRVTGYVRHTRPQLDDLADNVLAVLEYPRATTTVRSSVVEVNGGRRRQFVVCGYEGTAAIRPLETPRLELTLEKDQGPYRKGTQVVELPKSTGRYDGGWLDFARVIRGEKEHEFSHTHDLAAQHALLTACQMSVS